MVANFGLAFMAMISSAFASMYIVLFALYVHKLQTHVAPGKAALMFLFWIIIGSGSLAGLTLPEKKEDSQCQTS